MPEGYQGMYADTVDDTAMATEMQGPSSSLNQFNGRLSWASSPTRMLVLTWFVVLALYWFCGWFFRGQRS